MSQTQTLSAVEADAPAVRPEDYQPVIRPTIHRSYDRDPQVRHFKCMLTGDSFPVVDGSLVYELGTVRGDETDLCGPLAPTTVARGLSFIAERLRHKLEVKRANAIWNYEQANNWLAGLEHPILYQIPNAA